MELLKEFDMQYVLLVSVEDCQKYIYIYIAMNIPRIEKDRENIFANTIIVKKKKMNNTSPRIFIGRYIVLP